MPQSCKLLNSREVVECCMSVCIDRLISRSMPVQATPWWGATTSSMKRCGGGAQFILQLQQRSVNKTILQLIPKQFRCLIASSAMKRHMLWLSIMADRLALKSHTFRAKAKSKDVCSCGPDCKCNLGQCG